MPFTVTLAYSALAIYFLVKRGLRENMDRLLTLYLLLVIIWGSGQVLVYSDIPEPLPAFRWEQIVVYGLVVLSVAFWAFARSFLQKEDWMPAGWLVGLALLLVFSLVFSFVLIYFFGAGVVNYHLLTAREGGSADD